MEATLVTEKEYEEAYDKALRLLLRNLAPVQQKYWRKTGTIYAIGNVTGERYKIIAMNGARVAAVVTEKHYYCVVSVDVEVYTDRYGEVIESPINVPLGDDVLVKKLLIETAEDEFLRIAVRSVRSPMWEYP